MVLHWMDLDRGHQLESRDVLPVIPACRELLLMATMRQVRDRELFCRVARRFVDNLLSAVHESG
jgi:hypothetical protein